MKSCLVGIDHFYCMNMLNGFLQDREICLITYFLRKKYASMHCAGLYAFLLLGLYDYFCSIMH